MGPTSNCANCEDGKEIKANGSHTGVYLHNTRLYINQAETSLADYIWAVDHGGLFAFQFHESIRF